LFGVKELLPWESACAAKWRHEMKPVWVLPVTKEAFEMQTIGTHKTRSISFYATELI
jgi:hypothetical protein